MKHLILACVLLAFAATANAQWGVNHRGTSHGTSSGSVSAGHGSANVQRAASFSRGSSVGYYPGGSFYPSNYLGGGPLYSPMPTQPQYVPGVVTFAAEPAPMMGYNLYVPSYERPDDGGPTLAERAASLKSAGLKSGKKPAVLNWTNWPNTAASEKRN